MTDVGDRCTPSRSSSSSRSDVEGELIFAVVAEGPRANGPVCLESLSYPYFVVIGSAHNESVEDQLSFGRARTCAAMARASGGECGIPAGNSRQTFTSSI
jgi:hypothetical protein